jgi:hypothetical protein
MEPTDVTGYHCLVHELETEADRVRDGGIVAQLTDPFTYVLCLFGLIVGFIIGCWLNTKYALNDAIA